MLQCSDTAGVGWEMVVPARHSVGRETRDTGTGSPVSAPWDISLLLSVRSFGSAQFDGGLSGSKSDILKNAALAFLSENCGLFCVTQIIM
jgi:hypothetical protein